MREKLIKLTFGALVVLIASFSVLPTVLASVDENEAIVYYFWGFCPICSKPEEHVGLFDQYPVRVEVYEVFQDPAGRAVYDQFAEQLGIEIYGFPTVVFEGRYWLGFTESTQTEIVDAITAYLAGEDSTAQTGLIRVPFFGEVDLLASPILLTTVIIATLDGFNPCSLFVLTFLLAIIVHSASRKRIVLVGLTFLAVTSAVYGLFMLGILNIMIYAGGLFWIRNIVAAAVIILGLISIKDYLFFKEGVSVMIPDSYKQKYYSQVRRIFYTKSVIPAVLATTTMALGIALVELPCTAGFPFVWSSIAGRLDLSATYFAVLFAVYLFLYLLIELIVFFLAVLRMRSLKMTEEQGRFLKLVAGSLMFILGLILLVKPEYMENMLGILITFIAALVMLVVFRLIRRVVDRKKETGRPIQ
jgi:cytochrome c biogenesis protein CcdA